MMEVSDVDFPRVLGNNRDAISDEHAGRPIHRPRSGGSVRNRTAKSSRGLHRAAVLMLTRLFAEGARLEVTEQF
jgi:hypothetical protein